MLEPRLLPPVKMYLGSSIHFPAMYKSMKIRSVSRVIPSTARTSSLAPRQSTDYGSSSLPAKDIVGIMIGVAVLIIIFVWMFEVRVRNNAQRVKETRVSGNTVSRSVPHEQPNTSTSRGSSDISTITPYTVEYAWPRESTILPYTLKPEPGPQERTPEYVPSNPTITDSENLPSSGLSDALTERQTRLLDEAHNIRDALSIMEQQMPEASLLNDENTVGALQSRVSEMMGRMALLEAQIDSDWARGLTNEPPPEYDEAGDNSITHNNRR
ncbi:MAG: hypothetical protein NXY57DRAFT_214992 [Lentinula lateritia]|nr:MAG: hypothetical protein NXY57DRAFT_214992 [Lentinula lateritia]